AGECVNVLAVNRRDESLVEFADDVVRDLVALMLDLLDLVGVLPAVLEILKEFFEQRRAFPDVRRHLVEQGEIFLFFRQKTKHRRLLVLMWISPVSEGEEV